MANGKREAMGKGIRALLSDIGETPGTSSVGSLSGQSKRMGEVLNIPILEIKVNPFQPRVEFDDEKLEELGVEIIKAELQRIPTSAQSFSPDQMEDIEKLVDKIEDDEDVQAVYTNIAF